MRPAPRVIGVRHIPPSGPFVLVANHLEGPGLWIGWSAALLTHAVARARPDTRGAHPSLHWLVEADMDRARVGGWKKLVPGTAWAFRRVAKVWGMVAIPRTAAPAIRRATALRSLIRLVSPAPVGGGEPAGFFPEGEGDGINGLRLIPDAAGGLLALLGRRGVPSVPAAVWLEPVDGSGSRLTARIGPPWLPAGDGRSTATDAMVRIGAMLPPRMWGAYRGQIARHLEAGG